MIIFEKEYYAETLVDVQEDLFYEINKLVREDKLGLDENHQLQGAYLVQMVYKND